jgi:hypothetical protein
VHSSWTKETGIRQKIFIISFNQTKPNSKHMCLLIFKPQGITIPSSYLEAADIANPHGCGIAYPDGKITRTMKGAKWGADDIQRALASIGKAPAIIHFRYATHGSINNDNTHPFLLPNGIAAAHNGIISSVECGFDESDTRAYLRQYVAPAIQKGQDITSKSFLDTVGEQIGRGSKFVFMDGRGRYGIANEEAGHWHKGAWYSNTTYQERNYTWVLEDTVEDSTAHWHECDVAELACMDCGEHVASMAFGKSVLISPDTGNILCGECSRLEFEQHRSSITYKTR